MIKFIDITIDGHKVELPMNSKLVDIINDYPDIIPFRCKQGICGSCRIEVISGQEFLSPASKTEIDFLNKLGDTPGSIRLACQVDVAGSVNIRRTSKYFMKKKEILL